MTMVNSGLKGLSKHWFNVFRLFSGLPVAYPGSSAQQRSRCSTRISAGNSVFDIMSLTWDEWSYPEGVILPIVTLGTIRPKDSGAAQNATEFQH